MTEEATEKLVRLFLQYNGFLVRTNVKYFVAKNKNLEVDIVALKHSTLKHRIPNKIIGYVVSWELGVKHFEPLHRKFSPKSREEFKRLKLLSNKKYKKSFLKQVEKEYGIKGFKFCIFARGIVKKHDTVVRNFLDKEGIVFVPLKDVIRGMLEYVKLRKYENDSEYQLLRLMKFYGMIKNI